MVMKLPNTKQTHNFIYIYPKSTLCYIHYVHARKFHVKTSTVGFQHSAAVTMVTEVENLSLCVESLTA